MPKPIKSHVSRILAKNDRDQKIHTALTHAWDCRKDHPGNETWRRKTTRAHIVWEAGVDKLVELLADDPGVRVVEHHDTVSFVFDDAVLLRLKKADIALRSSNIHTALSELFDNHETDLFGYQGLQRVEACYVLNAFETKMLWCGIVARDQGTRLWCIELGVEKEEIAAEGKILEFPKPERESTAALAKLRDRDATSQKKKDAKDMPDGE